MRDNNKLILGTELYSLQLRMSKLDTFLTLGCYDQTTGTTHHVRIADHPELQMGNGGDWCRQSNVKEHKLAVMYSNGSVKYRWDPDDDEREAVEADFRANCVPSQQGVRRIEFVKVFGRKEAEASRSIRADIKRYYANKPCVSCGSVSNLVCDHKNDLYNDPRVLDTATQKLTDFQSLCNSCNLRKRQVAKETRRTGKRYPATRIPCMAPFGIAFTLGGEDYDPKDPNAMVGTYWYDPVLFNRAVRLMIEASSASAQTIE